METLGRDRGRSLRRGRWPAGTWHPILLPIALFLTVYGAANCAELPLGWKDRRAQIGHDLAVTVHLGSGWVSATLWAIKLVEGALGAFALTALVRRRVAPLVVAICGWLVEFTVFASVDVWAADRSELSEHTAYFVVFTELLTVVLVVQLAVGVRQWLRQAVPQTQAEPQVDLSA